LPVLLWAGGKQPAAVDAQAGKLRNRNLCRVVINFFALEAAIFAEFVHPDQALDRAYQPDLG